jgi:transcriptional regulator with XRE-family HTH domain
MLLSNLREHRILAGYTQAELAEAVGVHRDTIIKLEGCKHPPRPRTLKALADALGVSTRDLVENGRGRS